MDEIEFTLDWPLTEEQWDVLEDADLEHTDNITFHTKHGKEVRFVKDTDVRSNWDYLRSLSVEDFAEWIIEQTEDDTPGWLDWLKQDRTP